MTRYRVSVQIRRYGEGVLDQEKTVYKTEEFDSDEDLCEALTTMVSQTLEDDRNYLDADGGSDA
jgi:hypothetical protein